MQIDPRNDRIVYYENILDSFIETQGICDIRGAAEKIVELEEREAAKEPSGYVRFPTDADEAALMCLLGEQFLRQHAPERLKCKPERETIEERGCSHCACLRCQLLRNGNEIEDAGSK